MKPISRRTLLSHSCWIGTAFGFGLRPWCRAQNSSPGKASGAISAAIHKGRAFLVDLLDADLGLLPEYRGAKVYWLFHDNYLASKVLATTHPSTAETITRAIRRQGVAESGKIESIFGEAKRPLPFRQFELQDVRQVGSKIIRTEVATDRPLEGWEAYADLLLFACVAKRDQEEVRRHWKAAMEMWDGKGFLDAAAKHHQRYATYKLGLALLAAERFSPPVAPPAGMIDKLLALQDDSGGWITDYDASGKRIGMANVETTCLSILGLEACHRLPNGKRE